MIVAAVAAVYVALAVVLYAAGRVAEHKRRQVRDQAAGHARVAAAFRAEAARAAQNGHVPPPEPPPHPPALPPMH